MAKLVILGSSNALSSPESENTHMLLAGDQRTVLVDCANNPVHRLEKASIDFQNLTDIVLTHFHPDHVSGIPLLLMDMWLRGREEPLSIYGLHYTLDRMEQLMSMYSWDMWPNFFPVAFYRLPLEESTLVLDSEEFRIVSSPVCHLIPTIGLRFESKETGKQIAYSCDTEPCDEVVRLSKGVDILIHEASGDSPGHSSAEQAGQIASRAEVRQLYLIHYPTGKFADESLVAQANRRYQGEVNLATDFMTLKFE